jgi:hypothetical protein
MPIRIMSTSSDLGLVETYRKLTSEFVARACLDPWTAYDAVAAGFGAECCRPFFVDSPSNVVLPAHWEPDFDPDAAEPVDIEPDSDRTLGLRQ